MSPISSIIRDPRDVEIHRLAERFRNQEAAAKRLAARGELVQAATCCERAAKLREQVATMDAAFLAATWTGAEACL